MDDPVLGITTPDVFMPYAVRGFFDNGGQRLYVARVIGATAALAGVTANAIRFDASGRGLWGNNIRFRIAAPSQRPNEYFKLLVLYYRDPAKFAGLVDPTNPAIPTTSQNKDLKREPDVLEVYDNLSMRQDDANFAATVVNAQSRLIRLTIPAGTARPAPNPNLVALAGGTHVNPTPDDYLDANEPDIMLREGLSGLAAIDEVAILSAPGVHSASPVSGVANDVVLQCEKLKDRFAILNGPREDDPATVMPLLDSSYGAIYYPWIRVRATHTIDGHVLVPPAGHVAGIYARTDVERGVHKAPANEVVRGIITQDLPDNNKPLRYLVDKGQHDILNPRGINVIRDFRADRRGIRVWGARTMTSDALWKYVNVRRMFIFLEESIDQGTQWVVFEGNYEPTWQAVRLSVSGFLRSVWKSGALAGTTPEEAFFVRCDRTTMTQDDIDNGKLICLIGVAPVKPAEFVIFRISQKTVGTET
jgi:hypothetical protein